MLTTSPPMQIKYDNPKDYITIIKSLHTFRFPGVMQHNFVLKFHPPSLLTTVSPFPNCHLITFPPLQPYHLIILPPFPTCHLTLTPLTHLSHLVPSLQSYIFSTFLAHYSPTFPSSPLSQREIVTSKIVTFFH